MEIVALRNFALPLWREDRLLFMVVLGVSVLNSWLWWVPVRCVMDGPAFEWANTFGAGRLSGAGMGGHFPVLMLLSGCFVSLVYLGWRGGGAPFKPLLLLWCGVTFASSLSQYLANPDGYRFRGDTLGIDVNLGATMTALYGALFVAAAAWVLLDILWPRKRGIPAWTPLNTRWLALAVAVTPVQFVLLRFGPMHDATDVAGWFLTYGQWTMINLAFLPWVRRSA